MEIGSNIFTGLLVCALVTVCVYCALKCRTVGVKGLIPHLALVAVLTVVIAGFNTWLQINPSYELGAYPNEEHYYLGIEVTPEGQFTYLNTDFTTSTAQIDINDALIAGRINTIGFNNRYKKYKMLGPVKVTWDSYEDMVMISKFTAIQLGLMEATGAEDEKEFVIATDSDAAQELMEQVQ